MDRFAFGIGWRLTAILLLMGGGVAVYAWAHTWPVLVPIGAAWLVLVVNLYQFVIGVNRKLIRFLESVQYADFAVSFRTDNQLGPTFQDLNRQFNAVLDAFRQARAEKETSLHYVNTIVQHVSVGLLTFDANGQVELVNQTALRLLNSYRLRNLSELETTHPELATQLQAVSGAKGPIVYRTPADDELSIRGTAVQLRGRYITIVSIQNIRSELQQRELDAWQNLTKVLRHEIMNSITPIVSLVGTMRDIVETDLAPVAESGGGPVMVDVSDSIADLRDALATIEQRGTGIMQFVDAYRHFTTIPQPVLASVAVGALLDRVIRLALAAYPHCPIERGDVAASLTLRADAAQIEMVLLNLLKNAAESMERSAAPQIQVRVEQSGGQIRIHVADNGPGIEPEALEQIFIPFYTTRKTGSGIGLSLSRQIMQRHGGQLLVESQPGQGSTFTMIFG